MRESSNLQTSGNEIIVGTVSSVDVENRAARVIFSDRDDMVSGELKVLQNQPFILFKTWQTDESTKNADGEIEKVIISEDANFNYKGYYHSANRMFNSGEKYVKGDIASDGEVPTYTTSEPDIIERFNDKALIKVYPWLPYVGQLVVCAFLANGGGDGFVIGGL